jgi:hypothetical protein
MLNTRPQHSILKAHYMKFIYKRLQCRQYTAADWFVKYSSGILRFSISPRVFLWSCKRQILIFFYLDLRRCLLRYTFMIRLYKITDISRRKALNLLLFVKSWSCGSQGGSITCISSSNRDVLELYRVISLAQINRKDAEKASYSCVIFGS